jgi:hypothetical protein
MLTERTLAVVSALAISSLALAAGGEIPAGWSVHSDRKQICQFATPPDWTSDALTHAVWTSPDGKSSAVISGAAGLTLQDAKGVMEGNYAPDKVFEDTAGRLWYQYNTGGSTNWYVGVAVKGGVCGATLSFKDAAGEAVQKQIANTVGAR